ncbi:MAG: ATP-binding cassette domain-containing protein, partial [Rickettsiales bacterium]|nr:ATP-binding cassette domain-containing protein [Rickettsiales bacterium]
MQSISLSKISFSYPLSDDLFSDVSVVFDDSKKIAIIGDNGIGKTTLFKIISGQLEQGSGKIIRNATVYLLPQISAPDIKSGGERQQKELDQAFASNADILLLDEPTNNLDADARTNFFNQLYNWPGGVVIISHDRELLNRADIIMELTRNGIRIFGGNYDFYVQSRDAERKHLKSEYANTENRIAWLKKTKEIAAATAGASMNRLNKSKQHAVETGHKFKHGGNHPMDKIETVLSKKSKLIQKKLDEKFDERQKLSEQLRDDKIKIPMPAKPFPKNDLILIQDMSFGYDTKIFTDFNLQVRGGERIRISGRNGSGKTTLLKLILGHLKPHA